MDGEAVRRKEEELVEEMRTKSCSVCRLVVGDEEKGHEVLGVCCWSCKRA